MYSLRGLPDGQSVQGGVAEDNAGALFGVTKYGGFREGNDRGFGTVFKITRSRNRFRETFIHRFGKGKDGVQPGAAVIVDGSGTAYGTTVLGGAHNLGTVFKLKPYRTGYIETVIHSFSSGLDGALPVAPLIEDNSGALYGTTEGGGSGQGSSGPGTVFKLAPVGSHYVETILHRFSGPPDGFQPSAGLVADANGALYGTTQIGGSGPCEANSVIIGCGSVFKLAPFGATYKESTLYSFYGEADGAAPLAGVLLDATGAIYGTTSVGGGGSGFTCENIGPSFSGCGTVFKLTPTSSGYSESLIYEFQGGSDGEQPYGLVADGLGDLYGVTGLGAESGTAFELIPQIKNYVEHVLFRFQGPRAGGPTGSLIFDKNGALDGTTQGGGQCGYGAVFQLVPQFSSLLAPPWRIPRLHSTESTHADLAENTPDTSRKRIVCGAPP